MKSPVVIAEVNQGGSEVIGRDEKSFIQKVSQEIAEWRDVMKGSGVRAE